MLYCPGKVTPNADNNSCPLPGQYNILFNKHSQLSAFLIFTLYFTPSIFYLFIILPVEGCSANSRKLVFLKVLARDGFLNFIRCFILAVAPLSFHENQIAVIQDTRYLYHVFHFYAIFMDPRQVVLRSKKTNRLNTFTPFSIFHKPTGFIKMDRSYVSLIQNLIL